MDAQVAQEKALETLVTIAEDTSARLEVRIEAAKVILNRPRWFVGHDVTEA